MLDTAHNLQEAAAELGTPVEQLLTPLTRYKRRSEWFAIDNGAYSRFESGAFTALLEREKPNVATCRFVAVPDVVGSARRTLECFNHWKRHLCAWPLALVAQDGQEDLPIPWHEIAAVFIGGSTEWKLSNSAAQVIRAAKILGKWVHVGRVNTPGRFERFEELGADSIDGTGLSRYSWMHKEIYERAMAPQLALS